MRTLAALFKFDFSRMDIKCVHFLLVQSSPIRDIKSETNTFVNSVDAILERFGLVIIVNSPFNGTFCIWSVQVLVIYKQCGRGLELEERNLLIVTYITFYTVFGEYDC